MTPIPWSRGGWWHDYVCPTHGIELSPPGPDGHPCPRGCRLTGERFQAAWVVLEHQARAREARLLAHRYRATGDDADVDRALELIDAYARLYAEMVGDGWSEKAEPWMLRGKLFSQALTEGLWAVQMADAIRVLAADPAVRPRLSELVVRMLSGLRDTAREARRVLVDERGDLRSNYTAWLDCAGGMLARALAALGEPDDPEPWIKAMYEHVRVAVGDDGWEWEGATYYHLFVLRAYLLNLVAVDPAAVPADAADRLAGMVRVLTSLAAPDGALPVVHDGPYHRDGVYLEIVEVCVLAGRLWADPGTDRIEAYARAQLGARHDGLEDLLGGWFDGPPRPGIGVDRRSVHFDDVGVLVLRDRQDTWQAVVDAGPHGGSHGHLDKLALYLYGAGEAWQPAPGVPPYASGLRRGYYARTVAHPTVRLGDADQQPCAGEVLTWETGEITRALVRTDQAYPGVSVLREVIMHGDYLLDIVRVAVCSGDERVISLGLRPGTGLDVLAGDDGRWRSRWDAPGRPLHGLHVASAPSALETGPVRGPSHDPSAVLTGADWTATAAGIAMVSVFWPEGRSGVSGVSEIDLVTGTGSGASDDSAALQNSADGGSTGRVRPGRVRITLDDGRTDEYLWEDA